jgi:hypothetical protein
MVETITVERRSAPSSGPARASLRDRAAESMRTGRRLGTAAGVVAIALASGAAAVGASGGARSGGASAVWPAATAAVNRLDAARGVHHEGTNQAQAAARKAPSSVVAGALVSSVASTTVPTVQAAATRPPSITPTTQAAVPAPAPPAVIPAADPGIATLEAQVEA